MNNKREKDEHIEQLWYMKEDKTESLDALKAGMAGSYDADIVDELVCEGTVEVGQEGNTIRLTEKGNEYARGLIRAHRLAERLLHDVLGGDYELGACEFEHTLSAELVDGICTILGHPRACPHGMPIPEGDCCRNLSTVVQSSVVPLVDLKVGQSARVAYIDCKSDQQLHKIDSLRIKPGAVLTLHQRYPCYVVECEGGNIAMDATVASNISVWRKPQDRKEAGSQPVKEPKANRGIWGRFRRSR